MADKPKRASEYKSEQMELVQATCLYVATKLGDMMDDLLINSRGENKDAYDLCSPRPDCIATLPPLTFIRSSGLKCKNYGWLIRRRPLIRIEMQKLWLAYSPGPIRPPSGLKCKNYGWLICPAYLPNGWLICPQELWLAYLSDGAAVGVAVLFAEPTIARSHNRASETPTPAPARTKVRRQSVLWIWLFVRRVFLGIRLVWIRIVGNRPQLGKIERE